MHHTKADTDRTYVKREGGRALLQTEATYKGMILSNAEYINTKYKEANLYILLKSTKGTNRI